ncbi:MAG: hypothetical protein A2046_09725 [Bacteroidetes bacterium GWA2_30_7]|nr:MAG: hypothetical protein A2046_09725 [Bacteroidetes bacterium GWA2_30_7]
MDVFINDVSAFLPNEPVDNENIEKILGQLDNVCSKTKSIVLRNNQIKTRYYAIDPKTRKLTHTNSQLAAEAIKRLKPYENFSINDIELLCCGSSSPDVILPGHAVMVHGELGSNSCEVVSFSGICISGISSLKYAFMNIANGLSNNAVSSGSELSCASFRKEFFNQNISKNQDVENYPELAFDADFLRWMLSCGAGAMFLSNKKNENGISFKIEWIDILSHAGKMETCMYAGGIKDENGNVVGFRGFDSFGDALEKNVFALRQDVKLLNQEIAEVIVDKTLPVIAKKRNLKPEDITWFLPHFSSGYFKDKIKKRLEAIGFDIPYAKWFSNLYTKGNTGSAAVYIILEELYRSEKLRVNDKILIMVPESGRFSTAYALLTVV